LEKIKIWLTENNLEENVNLRNQISSFKVKLQALCDDFKAHLDSKYSEITSFNACQISAKFRILNMMNFIPDK
jgi:hypothetical protein